jgi:ATP-dependent helicase/DNAse subunit B
LQLPLYLAALEVQWGDRVRPAGMFFFPIRRRPKTVVAAPGPEDETPAVPDVVQARGAFDIDAMSLFGPLEAGERSPYVNVRLKKDGKTPWEAGDWLEPGLLEKLCQRACREAGRLAGRILDGRIEVRPLRSGNQVACANCPYADVCRIDPPTAVYRSAASFTRAEVVEALSAQR